MATDLDLNFATMFRDSVEKSAVLELRAKADWDQYHAIRDEARQTQLDAEKRFDDDRAGLIAKVTEDLLRDAGSLTHEHPSPYGTATDKFDESKIADRAEKLVDQAHRNEMQKLREQEAEAYTDLRVNIQARELRHDQVRGHAQDAFTRAADRRSGTDRRAQSRD